MKIKSFLILVGVYMFIMGFYYPYENNAKQYVEKQQAIIGKTFKIKLPAMPELLKTPKISLDIRAKDPFAVKDFVISHKKDVNINMLECKNDICGDGPPLSHQPYVLEQYPLESLLMVGTVKKTGGDFVALIQTPDGLVLEVKVGSYMGTKYGLIQNITENKIIIQEKIQFLNGWRNRKAVINLRD